MTSRILNYQSPVSQAIAEGATTPNPGVVGVTIWSSTLSKPVHWTGTKWTSGSLPAAQITHSVLGSPTFTNVQDIHNVTRSAGHLTGGDITNPSGANIAVAAGSGLIRGADDDTSTLFSFNWSALGSTAIPSNSIRYVYIDYNAGAPVVSITSSEVYDYRTTFPLGFVVNESGTLFINTTPHSAGRSAGRITRRNFEVDGRSRAHALGGLIISESGTKKVAVTSGVTWFRDIRDTFNAFDSNASGTFDRYYRDGVGGWTKEAAQTLVPDGLWDNGSGVLQSPTNRDYFNYWIYLGPSNNIIMVYGRENFNNLTQVLAANPPSDLPLRLQVGSLLLGRFIVYRNGGSITVDQVQTAFGATFSGVASNTHNTLGGLQGGIVDEYYHLTAAELTTVVSLSGATATVNQVPAWTGTTWVPSTPNGQVFTFGGTGTPTTGTDKTPWLRVMGGALTCQSIAIISKTAPTGAGFQVSVMASANNGTTFPTIVGTITLAAGSKIATATITTALAAGTVLRLDITSVNSAADWTVEIRAV